MNRTEFSKQCHETARLKGWWDGKPRSLGECAMLMITEIAEATEEVRNKRPAVYAISLDGSTQIESLEEIAAKGLKPEGEAVELADCLIRLGDYLGYVGGDYDNAIQELVNSIRENGMNSSLTALEQHLWICHPLTRADLLFSEDGKDITGLLQAWGKIELVFEKRGWNLEEILELKAAFNKTRSYRHGGKAL